MTDKTPTLQNEADKIEDFLQRLKVFPMRILYEEDKDILTRERVNELVQLVNDATPKDEILRVLKEWGVSEKGIEHILES